MSDLGRTLLALGIRSALTDRPPLRTLLARLPLVRLPGAIHVERGNHSFPLATGLALSAALSFILRLLRR